ncbi:DUF6480 family protein [Streptomyces sp. NPDC055749]
MRAELIAEQPVVGAGLFLSHAERSVDDLSPGRRTARRRLRATDQIARQDGPGPSHAGRWVRLAAIDPGRAADARARKQREPEHMTDPLVPPEETPPVEGSTAEAHQERPDGGMFEHPGLWVWLILIGAVIVAAFFIARVISL